MSIDISLPAAGLIRLESELLFRDTGSGALHAFLERIELVEEISAVTIRVTSRSADHETAAGPSPARRGVDGNGFGPVESGDRGSGDRGSGDLGSGEQGRRNGAPRRNGKAHAHVADIEFCPATHSPNRVLQGLAAGLRNGHAAPAPETAGRASKGRALDRLRVVPDPRGIVRLYRHGPILSTWQIRHELPGRIRLRNATLQRRKPLCQAVERELMSVLGVDNFKTNPTTGSVLILYDPRSIRKTQLIEILDSVLVHQADEHEGYDHPDLDFPLCSVSVPLAALAQFAFPPLLPVAAALFTYTALESFKGACDVVVRERRLGVDVLDSIVVVGCLATGSIFAGAVLCWCLSFGRVLVDKTRDDSKRMLLNVFGKQPRFVWLLREDGVQVETPLDELAQGDLIVVHTGEAVPVDGIVAEGMAMIDQHALTGESTPAEKGVGDRVYAATMMVAGKMHVQVEKSGNDTASAKISEILNNSAGYTLASQHRGEILADRAVIPTLAMGGLAMATLGPPGAVAVLNSDFGTGIRMAAPLAMLTSLTLCAHRGILVKDGRALELMNDVDTVLFDKTGTLTRERPEVGDLHAYGEFDPTVILQYAAAAEQRFSHPIARAILCKFEELGLPMPPTDESKYDVGYGITVGVDGRTVRVGSARFMELEGIAVPDAARADMERSHDLGHTLVMVAVDDCLGGAVELRASERPEVRAIVQGLRERGIEHIAIISGDHEAPTKRLADSLELDRYFAGVLPEDKASYVEKLQSEGRKVCFVGDGINDSIALKKANVSVSLRGASSIATDTAQIVFMEESLARLCDLLDISHDLHKNVRRSWNMILAPNILCIAGAFTLGFGVMASVVTNNVAAMAALANGLLPLQRVAKEQTRRELAIEIGTEDLHGG